MIGLGEVGSEYAKSMSSNFERPITVKGEKKGTGFGCCLFQIQKYHWLIFNRLI